MKILNGENDTVVQARRRLESRILGGLPGEFVRDNWYVLPLDTGWEGKSWHDQPVRVFSAAIQQALDTHQNVEIPYSEQPLYMDRPIVVNSGNALRVHPKTRIILMGDSLILRNRNLADGHYSEVSPGTSSDRDIWISGGIWEGPDTQLQFYGSERDYWGCDSLFMLHNVLNVRVEKLHMRNARRMAIQIGNCEHFVIQDLHLGVERDGVHVEGPAAYGLIRNISGQTGDDYVALNSWDWEEYSMSFGAIHDIIVEDIECKAEHLWSEIRLLAGTRRTPDGGITECPIYNILLRNIHGIHTVKMYHQKEPKLDDPQRGSVTSGTMYDLFFDNVTFGYYPAREYHTPKHAAFEIVAHVYGLFLKDIRFTYPLKSREYDDYAAVGIGPMSEGDFFGAEPVGDVPVISIERIYDTNGAVTDPEKLVIQRNRQ